MTPFWPDLRSDVERLLSWKVQGLHPAVFFGPRQHPIHEVCKTCHKTVDFPISRRCPACGVYQEQKNPQPQNHNGLDIGKARGTTILLPWDGTVVDSYFDPKVRDGGHGGGWSLIVEHMSAPVKRTGYCHMDVQALLKKGQSYKAGDLLGKVGSSGDSTNPHLHLTCRTDVLINPLDVLMLEFTIAELPWYSIG